MKLLSFILIIFCVSSCRPPEDPDSAGIVPCTPEQGWRPNPDIQRPCYEEYPDHFDINKMKKLPLGEMINIALKNNPITTQKWADARAAAFGYEASKSTLYPSIAITETGEVIRQNTLSNNTTTTNNGFININGPTGSNITGGSSSTSTVTYGLLDVGITLNYLLLDFGGRDASIESAKQALFAANWNHQQTIQDVILNVLQAYYQYLQAKANVKAQEENLKDALTNVDAAQKLFAAGLNTKVDVLLAQSQMANTRMSLETFRGQVKIALAQLATAMGLPANTLFDVPDLPEQLPVHQVEQQLEKLMDEAMKKRADLASVYSTFLQQKANVEVAVSASLPTLSALGGYSRENFWNLNIKHFQQGIIGVQIQYPIFQGWFYENQIRQSEEMLLSSYESIKSKEFQVLNDVVTSYYAVQTAAESLKYSEEFLKYAQEAYVAILAGYKAGTQTALDLVASQGSLANARALFIQNSILWVSSISNLAHATGILDVGNEEIQLSPLYQEFNKVAR